MFDTGRGATDAICVVEQLQEKYLTVNKWLDVDLDKVFDCVPLEDYMMDTEKIGVC